jgi:multidrug efflux pump subunit AcrA (membrane-fusion protein)
MPAPSPAAVPEAQAAGLAPRPLLDRNEIRAQLMPRRYTTVAAEIGAKISSLPFVEGGSFKAGEALVTFDCSLQKAQLDKSRAELVSAEHTLNSNERLTALKLEKARAELDSAEHMVSSHERRTALKLDKARAELDSAEHMVSSHERRTALKLDKARAELDSADHIGRSHERRTAPNSQPTRMRAEPHSSSTKPAPNCNRFSTR